MPAKARVPWAQRVLQLCVAVATESAPEPVRRVLALTSDESRWGDAHDAFSGVRKLTLQAERGSGSGESGALLYVAEIVAKVTYNASGRSAPFDADSGWWLAPNAMVFARHTAKLEVEEAVWKALTVAPER